MAAKDNPFYIQPATADISPVLDGIGSIIRENREAKKKAKFQEDFRAAYDSDDPQAMFDFAANNPEASNLAMGAMNFKNEATRKNLVESMINIDSDPNRFAETLELRNDFLLSQGADPKDTQEALTRFAENPEREIAAMKKIMPLVMTKEEREAYLSSPSDAMKQQEIDIKREALNIRKLENEARKDEQQLKQETNQLKRDELKLKIEEKRNKIDQTKKEIQASSQTAIDGLDTNIATVDRLLKHPGLESAVGTSSALPSIPGTDRADFEAELESFDAKLFSSAVQQMRGLGSLSEAEGRKISAAVGAINPKMSEKAFRNSLNVIKEGFALAKSRLAGAQPEPDVVDSATKDPLGIL